MSSWPKVDPGKMVHQITFLQQVKGTNISGTVMTWAPWLTTWASIDPVRGIDMLKAGQDVTQVYLTIKIRWQTGILPNMRIQSDMGETYIIQAIENPGERNVILVLTCLAMGLNQ